MPTSTFLPSHQAPSEIPNELMRSSIYIQYLLDYETKLIEHIENFGENDYSVPLPFTIKNVYNHL